MVVCIRLSCLDDVALLEIPTFDRYDLTEDFASVARATLNIMARPI